MGGGGIRNMDPKAKTKVFDIFRLEDHQMSAKRRDRIRKELNELRKVKNFKKRTLRGGRPRGYTSTNKKRTKERVETSPYPIKPIGNPIGEIGETDKQSTES